MKSLLALLFTVMFSMVANPTAASELLESRQKLIKSGEGEMNYLFWTIYRAELYIESLPFEENSLPKVLKIEYFRDIESEDLVDATTAQWLHIGIDDASISKWAMLLSGMWPDISEGDELILYVSENGESTFYAGEDGFAVKKLGEVNDTDFGPAFLNIWLSEKTSEPELRAKLLGSL